MDGLRDRLKRAPAVGAWCNLPAPAIAEMAGAAGFHFVCVDFQHGLIEMDLAESMFRAAEAGGAAPVARAAWDAASLGRLLDRGAEAVIVPMIDSLRDARAAAAACKYSPMGRRSFGPTRAVGRDASNILSEANRRTLVLPMIETRGRWTQRRTSRHWRA